MYNITEMLDGRWWVECRIQDGTERWFKPSRTEAVVSLISGARVLNGSYIREDDISFHQEVPQAQMVTTCEQLLSKEDEKLLSDIKSRRKVVLDWDDYRLKYRITHEECEKIVAIREGRLTVSTT